MAFLGRAGEEDAAAGRRDGRLGLQHAGVHDLHDGSHHRAGEVLLPDTEAPALPRGAGPHKQRRENLAVQLRDAHRATAHGLHGRAHEGGLVVCGQVGGQHIAEVRGRGRRFSGSWWFEEVGGSAEAGG